MDDVLESDDLRLLDVLIEESLRESAAPAVRARPRRHWLAAALVLLGVATVVGASLLPKRDVAPPIPAQPSPEPLPQPPAPPSPPSRALNSLRLRVVDTLGAPVRAFELGLRQVFAGQPLAFGTVKSFADRTVAAGDFTGDFVSVEGLPDGEFVLQVTADRDARTRSAPFRIGGTVPPDDLTVQLTSGGELAGEVRDDAGLAVAGALVVTGPDSEMDPSSDMFARIRELLPDVVTVAQTRTDASGRFRLPALASGRYMLHVRHPDFCDGFVRGLRVVDERPQQVPGIALARGTLVEGTVTLGNGAAGPVHVTITSPLPAGAAPTKFPFSMTAAVDEHGRFRFERRLAPGSYQISAYRAPAGGNALMLGGAIRDAAQSLSIESGRDRIERHLELKN